MAPLPDQIIGFEKQVGELLLDIARRNVAHAYLFVGPPHLGKFTIARWFASRLLCDHLPPDQHTVVQSQVERLIHPDYLSMDRLWVEETDDDWKSLSQYSNVRQNSLKKHLLFRMKY
jgi:DNA polymerase III delta prime subunit